MQKINKKVSYTYDNKDYFLKGQVNNISIFMCLNRRHCLIVDKEENVLFEIKAWSKSNIGYLKNLNKKTANNAKD